MDELGNWIYIILMVVVGISSLYSSMNKKRRQQQVEIPEPEMSETPYQELPVPAPFPAPASMKKVRPTRSPVTEHFRHQPLSSLMTFPLAESSEQTAISQTPDDDFISNDDLDLTNADSLRKAIIYSEIINRKVYSVGI